MSHEPARDIKRARSPSAIASRMGGGRRSMGSGIETIPRPSDHLQRGGVGGVYVGDNRTFFGEVENPDPFATYVGLSDLGGYVSGTIGGEEDEDEEERRLLAGFEATSYFSGYPPPPPHYSLDPYSRPVIVGGQTTTAAGGASFGHSMPLNTSISSIGGVSNVFGWYGGGGATAENHMSDDEDEEDYEEWDEEEEEEGEGDDEGGALAGIENDHDTTSTAGNPHQGILTLSRRMESVARAAKELFGVSIFPSSRHLNQHNTESSTAPFPSSSSSSSSSLLLPLTDINLEAIVASGVPITLTLCFEGVVCVTAANAATATAKTTSLPGAAQQRFVSSDPNGARGILAHIRECIAKKKFFDVSKLELYVMVLQEKRKMVTGTDEINDDESNNDNSPQQGYTSLARIGGFLTFVTSPFVRDSDGNSSPHEQHCDQILISALPALLRLLGSSANQKLLLDVGDFWSPFLLNVVGSASTQMENVLDLRTCIAACSGVPECRLVDPSSVVNSIAGPLNYSFSRCEDDDGNSPYWAIATREGLWNPPTTTESSPLLTSASVAHHAYPLLRRAFAVGLLYKEIMESFSRAPVLSAASPGSGNSSVGDHYNASSSLTSSSSSSTLMAAAQRETAALYACALMTHNGLHVDVAKAVRLLARLVGRSRQLYAAMDAVLLGPLRNTCDGKKDTVGGQEEGSGAATTDDSSTAAAFGQQELVEGSEAAQNSTPAGAVGASLSNQIRVLPFPETDRELIALIARYWNHFVAANAASPTPTPTPTLISSTAPTPIDAEADDDSAAVVGPSDFSVSSLSDPLFLRRCPVAAAWAYAKSLREVGSTLQRFLRPLGPDIAASVLAAEELQRSRVESERLSFEEEQNAMNKNGGGGGGGGGKGAQQPPPSLSRLPIPLPLLDVHPTFNLNSVTGRIFARNPNVQTLRASPMLVTSGDELADRLVERLIVSWRTQCCGGGAEGFAGLDVETLSSPLPPFITTAATSHAAELLTAPTPCSRLSRLSLNLRALFVAPPGTIMLSFDYNQIELRVLAHLSRDPSLMKAFATPCSEPEKNESEKPQASSAGTERSRGGNDVLSFVASLMFNLPSGDAVTPSQRSQAKVVVYGLLYGMGNKALQQRLDETLKGGSVSSPANTPRAAELRDLFNTAFPVATAYLNSVGSEACVTLIVSTMGGKYRQLHIDHPRSGGGAAGDQQQPPQNNQWWSRSPLSGYGYDQNQMAIRNQAVSMRIQGSAADILKGAMVDLAKYSPTFRGGGGGNASEQQLTTDQPLPFAMLLSLHDELVFVCPDARRKKKRGGGGSGSAQTSQQQKTFCPVAATIKYISAVMESQADRFGMCVPLTVSAKIGKAFGELRPCAEAVTAALEAEADGNAV